MQVIPASKEYCKVEIQTRTMKGRERTTKHNVDRYKSCVRQEGKHNRHNTLQSKIVSKILQDNKLTFGNENFELFPSFQLIESNTF